MRKCVWLGAVCGCVQVPEVVVAVELNLKMWRDFTRKKGDSPG